MADYKFAVILSALLFAVGPNITQTDCECDMTLSALIILCSMFLLVVYIDLTPFNRQMVDHAHFAYEMIISYIFFYLSVGILWDTVECYLTYGLAKTLDTTFDCYICPEAGSNIYVALVYAIAFALLYLVMSALGIVVRMPTLADYCE